MDYISDGVKRKKLRTRKNLDELRRKSRGTYKSDKKLNKCGVTYKTNNLLTSQRLTLRFCHKAVQSKTILRSKSRKVQSTPKQKSIQLICDKNNSMSSSQEQVEKTLNHESPLFPPRDTEPNSIADNLRSSIIERDYSDDEQRIDALLDYISEYIIPDVDVDVMAEHKILLQAYCENQENHLREQALQNQNNENSTVLHTISDESQHDIHNSYNAPDERSNTNSVGNISTDVMEEILRNSPIYEFYPHRLNQ